MPYARLKVATQFSTGSGVYLPEHRLVVTGERVVNQGASVVLSSEGMDDQLAEVVYLDFPNDLAFLRPTEGMPEIGGTSAPSIEAFLREEGLPVQTTEAVVTASLEAFREGAGERAARCVACQRVVFERAGTPPPAYCPHCDEPITLPGALIDPVPTGVEATIEEIIATAGHDPRLARRGPYMWHIKKGSADIQVTYHEDSGMVTGDAYLCELPDAAPGELFSYLLRQNFELKQLSFSTYGRDIVLSLLIYDRYLTVDTALPLFEHLFERADYFDDVLVSRFGAGWAG